MSVTFLLPAGPKNIAPLFPGVDLTGVEEYYLELTTPDGTLATTNRYTRGCCCTEETVRVFFVNYAGAIDAVSMKVLTKETDIKSTVWKKPNTWPLKKWDGGLQRSNVKGTRTMVLETSCYTETDMPWLEELKATPNAWIKLPGAQGQSDAYVPVVVEDGKFVTRKEGERYYYPFQLQLTLSNELFTTRN